MKQADETGGMKQAGGNRQDETGWMKQVGQDR